MRTEIRIKGKIDEHWSSWFEDLELVHDRNRDETLLRGEIVDQATLYGLLAKLRDLGLGLLSVTVSNTGCAGNGALGQANLGKANLGEAALGETEALDT